MKRKKVRKKKARSSSTMTKKNKEKRMTTVKAVAMMRMTRNMIRKNKMKWRRKLPSLLRKNQNLKYYSRNLKY